MNKKRNWDDKVTCINKNSIGNAEHPSREKKISSEEIPQNILEVA